MEAGFIPQALFLCLDLLATKEVKRWEAFRNLMERQGRGECIWTLSDHLFNHLAKTERPQGLIAFVEPPQFELENLKNPTRGYLIAAGVQDPGNLGTLIRIADAFGLDGFVCDDSSAWPWSQKVVRSTMGSLFHIPVMRVSDLGAVLDFLRKEGTVIVATAMTGKPLPEIGNYVSLERPVALLMGNEGSGLPTDILAETDVTTTIPMDGRAESLNVAVAAGICCYELFPQQLG